MCTLDVKMYIKLMVCKTVKFNIKNSIQTLQKEKSGKEKSVYGQVEKKTLGQTSKSEEEFGHVKVKRGEHVVS